MNSLEFPNHIKKCVKDEYKTKFHLPLIINGVKKIVSDRTLSFELDKNDSVLYISTYTLRLSCIIYLY